MTGSSRNLGAAIARRFGAHRATVAVHYQHDADAARRVVDELIAAGGEAGCFGADLAQSGAAERLVQAVQDRFGRVDILVHAAGPYADLPFATLDEATWDRVMNVNLRAVYGLAKDALRRLVASLAMELAPAVTVNAIAPRQIVDTPGWKRSRRAACKRSSTRRRCNAW